jgi:hypothetical protein
MRLFFFSVIVVGIIGLMIPEIYAIHEVEFVNPIPWGEYLVDVKCTGNGGEQQVIISKEGYQVNGGKNYVPNHIQKIDVKYKLLDESGSVITNTPKIFDPTYTQYADHLLISSNALGEIKVDFDSRCLFEREFQSVPEPLPPLTENEYRVLIEAIYAKGSEYERECSQKTSQFAYNDCMNRVQTWQLDRLDEADSRCCVQGGGGGCLIATAAFGSELAPQVQFLRELRDNTVLQTTSGTSFINGFNQFYYSFSPAVADYERENPVFKETVKVTLTPLLTSLTLLNYVEIDTEEEMLGYGIGIILLNIGMYFIAPAALIIALKKRFL